MKIRHYIWFFVLAVTLFGVLYGLFSKIPAKSSGNIVVTNLVFREHERLAHIVCIRFTGTRCDETYMTLIDAAQSDWIVDGTIIQVPVGYEDERWEEFGRNPNLVIDRPWERIPQ